MQMIDDWPTPEPTEILRNLWMGGLQDSDYLGEPLGEDHYAFESTYDVVLTLYADAQPAPWGVTELRYGFPDDDIPDQLLTPCLPLAHYGWSAWSAGARVLVRCQQGVNRSGLVTALILMFDGMSAPDTITHLRDRRGPAVLNNVRFVHWLTGTAPAHIAPTTA